MKICVIWSSPNADGLTAAAKNHVIEGLRDGGAEVDEVRLNRLHLEHCRACGDGWGLCHLRGACVIKDDFASLYQRLMEADGIVWVTAVYWHDATEQMKAFIDRLRRCETAHNGYLQGKRNMLVACAGGSGFGTPQCLHQMEEALLHMKMEAVDRLPVNQFDRDYMLPALAGAGRAFARLFASDAETSGMC